MLAGFISCCTTLVWSIVLNEPSEILYIEYLHKPFLSKYMPKKSKFFSRNGLVGYAYAWVIKSIIKLENSGVPFYQKCVNPVWAQHLSVPARGPHLPPTTEKIITVGRSKLKSSTSPFSLIPFLSTVERSLPFWGTLWCGCGQMLNTITKSWPVNTDLYLLKLLYF